MYRINVYCLKYSLARHYGYDDHARRFWGSETGSTSNLVWKFSTHTDVHCVAAPLHSAPNLLIAKGGQLRAVAGESSVRAHGYIHHTRKPTKGRRVLAPFIISALVTTSYFILSPFLNHVSQTLKTSYIERCHLVKLPNISRPYLSSMFCGLPLPTSESTVMARCFELQWLTYFLHFEHSPSHSPGVPAHLS
ncbi:uncharacterized protein BDR25DRAFT_348734 [Lindgomyces ingoldianus]|uniref:Uncharacterized protein n=1 Tax=Lindgomyces ingoldianus TaxID=673940 RepID=A0ACB6RBW6_9PLEO|nr:uncharacterized protein BDR25DRAFT_348734 [Lindgomyces ingoldianus]KAF2476809.1 hypothetical protein BDR25DRAFT_348734 [Lindgomyces ingoldianus]